MRVREVLGSLSFRYTAKYVIVLSASVFLLLAGFYALFTRNYFHELFDSVAEELETLQLVYRGQDLPGVEQYIDDSVSRPAFHRFSYLVTDAGGQRIAGDLPADSSYEEFEGGWLAFQMNLLDWGQEIEVEFIGRRLPLDDDYQVLVARDYRDVIDRAKLVFATLFRAMIATAILGVIGGFLTAARALAQVESMNLQLQRIVRGNPQERLDLTEQSGYVRELGQRLNQTLEQMETLMEGVRTVSDNIAHDLRTPLTRIRNRLSQLRSRAQQSQGEDVQAILDDCDDLLATFNALLRISALESGGQPLAAQPLDMVALLKDVVELYEPVANSRDISIDNHLVGTSEISGDSDLLFQMFANLLDNAIKYSPPGGRITLDLHNAGDEGFTVQISDSGPGIPPAERKNVFRRFYRLDSARSEQSGNGLGLSMAQAIARHHGGIVALGNNNPGLQVRVRLPRSR